MLSQKLMERIELLEEIRLAERQVDEGKGLGHEEARNAVLTRLMK
jgi:hypothetical protein